MLVVIAVTAAAAVMIRRRFGQEDRRRRNHLSRGALFEGHDEESFVEFDECAAKYGSAVASGWKCVCLLPRVSYTSRFDFQDESPLVPRGMAIRLGTGSRGRDGEGASDANEPDNLGAYFTDDFLTGESLGHHEAFLIQPPLGHHETFQGGASGASGPPLWTISARITDADGNARDVEVDPRSHGTQVTCGVVGYGEVTEQLHFFAGTFDFARRIPQMPSRRTEQPLDQPPMRISVRDCGSFFEVDRRGGRVLKYIKKYCVASDVRLLDEAVTGQGPTALGWKSGDGNHQKRSYTSEKEQKQLREDARAAKVMKRAAGYHGF